MDSRPLVLPLPLDVWILHIVPRMTPLLSVMAFGATCQDAHDMAVAHGVELLTEVNLHHARSKAGKDKPVLPTMIPVVRDASAMVFGARHWVGVFSRTDGCALTPLAEATPAFLHWIPTWWWKAAASHGGDAVELAEVLHASNTSRADMACHNLLEALIACSGLPRARASPKESVRAIAQRYAMVSGRVALLAEPDTLAHLIGGTPAARKSAMIHALSSGEPRMVDAVSGALNWMRADWTKDPDLVLEGMVSGSPVLMDALFDAAASMIMCVITVPSLEDAYFMRATDFDDARAFATTFLARLVARLPAPHLEPVLTRLHEHCGARDYLFQWPICAAVARVLLSREDCGGAAAVWWWKKVVATSPGVRKELDPWLASCIVGRNAHLSIACPANRALTFLATHGCVTDAVAVTRHMQFHVLAEHLAAVYAASSAAAMKIPADQPPGLVRAIHPTTLRAMTAASCYHGDMDAMRAAVETMAKGERAPHELERRAGRARGAEWIPLGGARGVDELHVRPRPREEAQGDAWPQHLFGDAEDEAGMGFNQHFVDATLDDEVERMQLRRMQGAPEEIRHLRREIRVDDNTLEVLHLLREIRDLAPAPRPLGRAVPRQDVFVRIDGAVGDHDDDDDVPPLVDTDAPPPAEHIALVMEQVPKATRAQAVAALKKTHGDVVNAIMELVMGGDHVLADAAALGPMLTDHDRQ